jgi:hypothetical protein
VPLRVVLKLTLFPGDPVVTRGGTRDARDPTAVSGWALRPQIVEQARAGHTRGEIAREFGCSAQTVTNWIAEADIDDGKPPPATMA